jgi:cell division protein FtsI/penicillin-binding protein 2
VHYGSGSGSGSNASRPSRVRPPHSMSPRFTSSRLLVSLRALPPGALRAAAAVLAVAILAISFIGGCAAEPSAEPTVRSFLLAWEQGRYWDAAGYTTGTRTAVAAALRDEYRQLGAAALFLTMGSISVHGDQADARFSASVDLGQDGAPWRYEGDFPLQRAGNDWKIAWSPSVINPHLRSGLRFAVETGVPERASVLDSARQPLIPESPAYLVGVRPDQLADPKTTAAKFAALTGLDEGQVLAQILAAPSDKFQELLTLNPADFARLRHRLHRIKGLQVYRVQRRLFATSARGIVGTVGTENALPLQQEGVSYQPGATIGGSGLEQVYQHRLAGSPTTEVVVENAKGRVVSVLQKWQGQQPTPVRTTIDATMQTAADRAVRSASGAATIIAVQSSTGHILAVAGRSGNGQRMSAGTALDGRYPPGEAFTIVSSAALLASGFSPDADIPCAQSKNVGGETFTNNPPEPGLGAQTPFRLDFAQGCGTAFAGLSRLLTANQLTKAAAKFGLGADWQLPLPAFNGSVRAPATDAEQAADTIGEGGVLVSPLAMALVAAEVGSGSWHRPILVTDPPDPANVSVAPFAPALMGTVRSLMRGTVASGAARVANLAGTPVYGQVGSAPIGTGASRTWANWFVGFRGDVAFAVLTLGKPGGPGAAPVAAEFLRTGG